MRERERERVKQGHKFRDCQVCKPTVLAHFVHCPLSAASPHNTPSCSKYRDSCIASGQLFSQRPPTGWTHSAAHSWLQHLSGVTTKTKILKRLYAVSAQQAVNGATHP